MKTHYELLGLEASADVDAIKRAFRREIARYHPDKVIHLGAEFQEMAATRAAELTVAYKTLTDPALREEYNASIASGPSPSYLPQTPKPAPEPSPKADPAPHVDEPAYAQPPGSRGRFAAERADRDEILKRAIAGRVSSAVEALYGKLETPIVRGFDLAIVPLAKPRFLGSPPPRVLIRVVETADLATIVDAFNAAARARLHVARSPVVVLLFARHLPPQQEFSRANEQNARHRKAPDSPDEVAVVLVDSADWSCRLPPNCSSAVRKLAAQICP